MLGTLLYLPLTLLAPLEPAAAQIVAEEPAATPAVALDWPEYGRGAIGLLDDDEVLASYGGDEAYPMASVTKIVTALVVLDKHPLAVGEPGPTIRMGAADVALRSHYSDEFRAKVFPVWAGLSFTERELLDLALIESAANYAGSLVNWAFGSDEEFAAAARTWLDAHGLAGITIVEPTGLDPGQHRDPERPPRTRPDRARSSGRQGDRRHQGGDDPRRRPAREHQRAARIVGRDRHQDRNPRRVRSQPPVLRAGADRRRRRGRRSSASCSVARVRSTTSSTPT